MEDFLRLKLLHQQSPSVVSSPVTTWCETKYQFKPFYIRVGIISIFNISARTIPFVVGVHTDDDEVTNASGTATAILNEQSIVPGGITGFHLTYALQC